MYELRDLSLHAQEVKENEDILSLICNSNDALLRDYTNECKRNPNYSHYISHLTKQRNKSEDHLGRSFRHGESSGTLKRKEKRERFCFSLFIYILLYIYEYI